MTHLESDTGPGLLDPLGCPDLRAPAGLAASADAAAGRRDRRARGRADDRLRNHPGYRNLLTVKGIGPVLAAMFVVEIGDVSRFRPPARCAAGPATPRHYESDKTVRRGHISKEGARWSGGLRSRRSSASANPRSKPSRTGSWPAAGRPPATSRRSPPPAGCSRSSTTSCATGTPAASPAPRHEHPKTSCGPGNAMTTHRCGRVSEWPHAPPNRGHPHGFMQHLAKECLAAPPAPRLPDRSRPQPHTDDAGAKSCASLGRPQHRSSSLRSGRSVLTPPCARRCPKAPATREERSDKAVDSPTPFRNGWDRLLTAASRSMPR